MKMTIKLLLATAMLLSLSGCGGLIPSVTVGIGDQEVIIATKNIEDEWGCEKVGEGAFKGDSAIILGLIPISDSKKEAEKKTLDYFAKEALKVNANYVVREFTTYSGLGGLYVSLDNTDAEYYNCQSIPNK